MLVLAGQLNQASKEDLLVFGGGVQMVKTYMFILEAASLNVILIVSGYLYFGSYRLILSASTVGKHVLINCTKKPFSARW